ncbi:MAG: methyltransferase domain-containing protein [Bacteroidetes bacterium]|nr:methyltransferase domain-containing protein [Bacteroidota bacterium]
MEQAQQRIIDYYNAFYDSDGFDYYPPEITREVLKALCRRAGVKPGARVLDVGCATGFYSAIFSELGYDVTGIDISETAIRRAREFYPGIRFEIQDATALPWAEDSFDFVFALGVSVANTRRMPALHDWLAHLRGVLATGGTLALLGGSDLSGEVAKRSDWFNHTWNEILEFTPPWAREAHGPWLTHFRLMQLLPPSLSMCDATTRLLRLLPARHVRNIILLLKNTP